MARQDGADLRDRIIAATVVLGAVRQTRRARHGVGLGHKPTQALTDVRQLPRQPVRQRVGPLTLGVRTRRRSRDGRVVALAEQQAGLALALVERRSELLLLLLDVVEDALDLSLRRLDLVELRKQSTDLRA